MASKLVDLEITGFEHVIKQFSTLDGKIQKKALRPALRAGAKVIQKSAKSKAPRLSGRLRKFIKVKSLKRSRGQIGVAIQTGTRLELQIPRDEQGYYPFSIEFGTKNVKKQPYMKPALREKRNEATAAVGKKLEMMIDKILKASKQGRK